jgi:hypothetical protein
METDRQKVKLSLISEKAIALKQHAVTTLADLRMLKAEGIAARATARALRESYAFERSTEEPPITFGARG